jgi:DNA-binding LacI/PurR family transcriptional regulator
MNVLRSKAEQLAEHLRREIAEGRIAAPLPNMRVWSSTLGVARRTLEYSCKILEREGLMQVRARRGIRLLQRPRKRRMDREPFNRVRVLSYSGNAPIGNWSKDIVYAMEKKLQRFEIGLSIEQCDARRLRTIHVAGESPHEMFLLASLPSRFQRLFADFRRSALIDGAVASGVNLPCLSIDVISAIRHATFRLAQRGTRKVYLVMKEGSQTPMKEIFKEICAEIPSRLEGEVVKIPNEVHEQSRAAQHLAMRMRAGQAMIAIFPVPANLLMTAVLQKGLKVPGEVEVVAMNADMHGIRAVPVPTRYPYPVEKLASALARIARNYFEKGKIPLLTRWIPLEMAVD